MNQQSTGQNSCRLCSSSATLCRSHVLPEMAYANVIDYTSHPRMVVVRDTKIGRISDTTRQTGFWERLLCEPCEGKFSRYETYASNHLLNVNFQRPAMAHTMVVCPIGDYALLKL